jgi:type IV pilus assembly protein PilC
MLYSYEAKDGSGRTVTGTVDAEEERAAANQILSQGYFLMRLKPAPNQVHAGAAVRPNQGPADMPVRQTFPRADESAPYYAAAPSVAMPEMAYAPGTAGYAQTANPFPEPPKSAGRVFVERVIYPIWSGVSLRDLAVLYRQLAALLNAGVSIPQSLQTLVAQGTRGQLKQSLTEMIQIVQSGGQLSDAMRRFPWIFHESHLAMITAGEQTGGLDTMCRRLADRLEQEYSVRQTVKKEMVMPILTLFAFFLLPPLFLFFVGNARGYYETAVVPLLQFFGVVGVIYACSRWLAQVRIITDTIYALLPIIGGVVRLLTYARFARTLATLYASGILVNVGIKYAADASGNTYIGRKILKSLDYLERGYGITDALAATRAFPPMVISMLSTSEHTGSLDVLMDKVADFYDAEAAVKLHQVCVSVGALATVIMGIKVLILLTKFYGGYYNSLLNMGD